jgi:hypothetical protein
VGAVKGLIVSRAVTSGVSYFISLFVSILLIPS